MVKLWYKQIKIKVIFSGNLEIDPSLEVRYGRVWQLLFENHIAWFPLLFNIADDDDKDDDELFLWYGWPTKGIQPYFQPGPLLEILTIANLRHTTSRVWTYAEPEFRLSWMKLCSSDNRYTTVPQMWTFTEYVLTVVCNKVCLHCSPNSVKERQILHMRFCCFSFFFVISLKNWKFDYLVFSWKLIFATSS